MNERYVATAVNRAITLSIVDAVSCARSAFRAFLVHPVRASPFGHASVAILPVNLRFASKAIHAERAHALLTGSDCEVRVSL